MTGPMTLFKVGESSEGIYKVIVNVKFTPNGKRLLVIPKANGFIHVKH